MKILFIRPKPSKETIGLQHLMIVEPLELEILISQIREMDEALIIDMILEKKPLEYFINTYKPDILCITGYISNVDTMIEYCRIGKSINSETKTIVGGVHCEVCPEDFVNENIDYRVVRNASKIFKDLLNHIDGKSTLPSGVLTYNQQLNDLILPDYDFNLPPASRKSVARYRDKYFYIFHNNVALLKTSFGCPYNCSFCFCIVITNGNYHQRPVEDVINELKTLEEKEIYIVDDDFLFNKAWLQEFIEQLKINKINKHFLVYSRADFIASNPKLMHDLKEIGLQTVIVGFESFSEEDLEKYNKKTTVKMYYDTMNILQKEKIDCFATIIIPPHWDKKDFKNMVNEVKKLGIQYVNLQPLTPLPRTDLSFPEEKLIISRKEYAKWDLAHITVQPDKLSVAEFYNQILKSYYSIIYQPKTLLNYLIKYKPKMLMKMLIGGLKVGRQYKQKIKEAKKYA